MMSVHSVLKIVCSVSLIYYKDQYDERLDKLHK